MRWWALVPVGLLGLGAVLVGLAALQGGAELALVVVVPVIVGRSLEFVVGVLCLVAGLFTLPLLFGPGEGEDELDPRTDAPGTTGGVGGLVLVGPVPIFFGSWKGVSTRIRVAAAIFGAAVVVTVVLALLFLRV